MFSSINKPLVVAAKFWVAATKKNVPNFVAVTKPFFPCNLCFRYEGKTGKERNLVIFKGVAINPICISTGRLERT